MGLTPVCWVEVYLWGVSSPHWVDQCWGEVGERAWTGPAVHWAKGESLSPTPLDPPKPPSAHGPDMEIFFTTTREDLKELTSCCHTVQDVCESVCAPLCRLWLPLAGTVLWIGSTGQ